VMAAARLQMRDIAATILKGSRLDALKHALGANRTNGLHRSNEDKRHCVGMALKEFAKESDRRIAEWCGVSNTFVSSLRSSQLSTVDNSVSSDLRTGRDGKQYKASKPTPVKPKPISGGLTFDVAEIEASVAVATKPSRNGKPTVSSKDRAEAVKELHAVIRRLQKLGIYDEFIEPLSQIAARIKTL
jgi:hypothetical protein